MKIYIGSDHDGFQHKEKIKKHLKKEKKEVIDLGPNNEESVDYPEFAHKVCKKIKSKKEKGILIAAVILFIIHLLFNWFWVPVFINKMYKISFAFIIIMFLLAGLSVAISWQEIPVWSRYILFPYFAWLCFAIVLNTYVLK